jgi:hypothetical protein
MTTAHITRIWVGHKDTLGPAMLAYTDSHLTPGDKTDILGIYTFFKDCEMVEVFAKADPTYAPLEEDYRFMAWCWTDALKHAGKDCYLPVIQEFRNVYYD